MGDICIILIQNGRRFITHSPTISNMVTIILGCTRLILGEKIQEKETYLFVFDLTFFCEFIDIKKIRPAEI